MHGTQKLKSRRFSKRSLVFLLTAIAGGWWFLDGGAGGFGSSRSPQAILVLGGAPSREQFAARFALQHPKLPIWVSSGSPEEYANDVFQSAGVPRHRVHLDYRAVDTVTNFTTLVDDLITDRIHHLYLITSDFHMPRASAIAAIVLGSQGITFTPVPIPTQHQSESFQHITRDILRAYFWIVSDRSGASITLKLKPERRPVFL